MKRFVTLIALLALTMVLVTGCGGVSQDEYDIAVKEASDLKAQLSNVQADLTTAQANLSKSAADLTTVKQNLTTVTADRDSIKSQLDKAKVDLIATQANLSKSNADLTTVQQTIATMNASAKAAQPYVDVATALAAADAAHWDSASTSKVAAAVSASQDSALKTAWDTIMATTGTAHQAGEWAFLSRLVQLLAEKVPKIN